MNHIESSRAALVQVLLKHADAATVADFLGEALIEVSRHLSCESLGLAAMRSGNWTGLAEAGGAFSVSTDLLGEALDSGQPTNLDGEFAVAVAASCLPNAVLAGSLTSAADNDFSDRLQGASEALAIACELVSRREQNLRRIDRLEAILEVAAQWNQSQEMASLLEHMAEASTRLLEAERASIFLWDRPNKTLVGRPALGVEGGVLRIPDNKGIVGQVVQSGEPRRVDLNDDQRDINRDVDSKLGFHTRSLLCVPLRGSKGELFGAFELINKTDGSFTGEDEAALVELAAHAAIALENTREHEQLVAVRDQAVDEATEGSQLIGDCPAVEALRSTIQRVADTDLAILILGENGTGKEVASKRVHYLSSRRNEPFVAVNCAALTETLLESELFGHEKGAFTDAHATRAGKFELASGGTLFLDEIGDMSLSGQAKLLRVLEEKVVVRVGGSQPIHTDARVIAATNQKLGELVREKKFREDLFFRLNVVTLELPPLRDRGDDIVQLAEHFLREFCVKARRKPAKFTAAAKKRLVGHSWPGNVRELRNLMERIAYLSQDEKVDADDLAFILSPGTDDDAMFALDQSLADATRRFQSEYIKRQIERARGSMTDAAQRLGLHRSNLYRKMRQLGMETSDEP